MPLAILSNHLSTRNQTDGGWLDDIVSDHSWVHRFAFDRIEQIPGILEKCAKTGVGTVAIDGGDGTAGLVFSELLNDGPYGALPALALLPSGKTNMTASAWSLKGNRQTALARLIQRHRDNDLEGAVHTQAILALQESENTPPRHGAFFGGADVVEGIQYCRRAIYPLGLPNAVSHSAAVAILIMRALSSGTQGGTIEVRFDETDAGEDGRFLFVIATTMDRMMLGVRPMPQEGQGPIHYMSLRPGPAAVLSSIPSFMRRQIRAGSSRTVRRSNGVSFSFSGSYTLDGELYEVNADQPFLVNGAQTLRFIRW